MKIAKIAFLHTPPFKNFNTLFLDFYYFIQQQNTDLK